MATLLKKRPLLFLLTILVLGGLLRFYGLNWDQGHHLHPDERAIVMFTIPINFPDSIKEFLSPASPLNPRFFAYGNFPLYLLKTTASLLANFDPLYLSYEKINLVGRAISTIADIGTLILIFLIGKKLFNKGVGLLAAFFYAISVFPIQTAHFYAVDTLLTFFITLTLYQLLRFHEKPSILNSILVGLFFGLSLATKTSATPLVIAIVLAIAVDFILLVIKQPHKPHIWFSHIPRFLKRLFFDGIVITVATVVTFTILQPYAIINFQEFLRQTQQVSQVTDNAFAFPFTLQYVGKIPYWYELKNIFLWGQGPILATLSFLGVLYITSLLIRNHLRGVPQAQHHLGGVKRSHLRGGRIDSSKVSGERPKTMKQFNNGTIILLIFFFAYFLIVGNFAVGFMRYMLPLYPLLSLFGAVFTLRLFALIMNLNLSKFSIFNFQFSIKSKKLNFKNYDIENSFQISNFKFQIGLLVFIGSILVWPLSFMHIYTKPNTRVLASQWIYQNIPPNKIIAREHWDDGLPIGGNVFYQTIELPIYEMQNPLTENQIYQMVQQADYIIIASNRLYAPLQRISKNCQKWNLPPQRCTHNASRYYEKLFSGELGYKKVAEFSVFPQFSIFNFSRNAGSRSAGQFSFDDSSADESFTVYDHPKVMIFKKTL